jgi:hypothetical protein
MTMQDGRGSAHCNRFSTSGDGSSTSTNSAGQRDHIRRAAAFPPRQARTTQPDREVRTPAERVRLIQTRECLVHGSLVIESDVTGRRTVLAVGVDGGERETGFAVVITAGEQRTKECSTVGVIRCIRKAPSAG